ncbi:RNA polymerase sigma-70 factor [Mucilaginibacter terrae]|uniref:RNA polymerase sigma-70 factor (Family 1) n=1 Tax=Mucilaginibacter terrae TaxID=1955052 RepID=A0ABU3GPB6_9SPHI|nr:RNA polymerase sigma-70 factor [Mucilaginibacter terrae]MDT3401619.1 RNA polymerase sigma-70 factor (family 1) [Mucilaginibacter terrae]
MNVCAAINDNELAVMLRQGSNAAFEEIYRRYWDKLFNSAHKRLADFELCEEVVQDIFVKLWEKRELLSISTGLSNYLHTAVKYSVIDYYRKRLTQDAFISVQLASPLADTSTEDNVILNDLKRYLETLIGQLPDKCRSVYQLSRAEHKTNKEIAAILNISEKTVEGHLTKALQALRFGMADYLPLAVLIFLKKSI